jgi:hypothetical protein
MQPFAAGYKLLAIGQSQFTIALKNAGFGSSMTTPLNVTYASVLESAPTVGSLKVGRIGGDYASDTLVELSNTLGLYSNNTPIMVIRETVNGTRVGQFLIDADMARTFDSLVEATARVGSDVTMVIHQWGTSDAGASDYGGLHDALNAATPTTPFDRSLPEVLGTDYEYLVMPLTRHSNVHTMENIRQASVAWAQANNKPIGPWFSDLQIDEGEGSTGAHQTATVLMGNPNFGAKTGVGVARALGLDTSTNPYFAQGVELSSDRTKITVTPVLPNGGTLYSPTPANLSQFWVSEDGGSTYNKDGFIAAIVNGKVEITKDNAGTFATGSIVRVPSDNRNFESGVWSEADIVAGVLYETYDKDRMGRGLMVMGGRDSNDNYLTVYVSDAAVLQGASVTQPALPTGAVYRGSSNLIDGPYVVSSDQISNANPVPWIDLSDGTKAWVAASLFSRTVGNPLPLQPELMNTRPGPSGPFNVMSLFDADSHVNMFVSGTSRSILTLQHQTPVANTALYYNDFGSSAYFNLSMWEVDLAAFNLSAAQAANAVNVGGSTSVELANVPAGSALFAAAYNQDGSVITWNGGTVNHTDVREVHGGQRRVSLMSGTASGNLTVAATAELLVVGIIPPV